MLNWSNITVQQYQDVYRFVEDESLDDMARLDAVIGSLFDLTANEVDNLSVEQYTSFAKQCTFVLEAVEIPGKAVKYIKANGRKYFVNYSPRTLLRNLRHRQYVEAMTFAEKPIENLHLFLASLVQPVRFGFWPVKNKAEQHEQVAEDMLHAPFVNAYHAAVFFCKLYEASMKVIGACLSEEMRRTGKLSKREADIMVKHLQSAMDGFSAPAR